MEEIAALRKHFLGLQHMEEIAAKPEWAHWCVTFFPSLINFNDLINQLHVCKPPALALSDEFRVASLV